MCLSVVLEICHWHIGITLKLVMSYSNTTRYTHTGTEPKSYSRSYWKTLNNKMCCFMWTNEKVLSTHNYTTILHLTNFPILGKVRGILLKVLGFLKSNGLSQSFRDFPKSGEMLDFLCRSFKTNKIFLEIGIQHINDKNRIRQHRFNEFKWGLVGFL